MQRLIQLKDLGKALNKATDKQKKLVETATIRTTNIVLKRAKDMLAGDVFEDTGINKATAKRRMTKHKASKGKPRAFLFITAQRVAYPSVRQLKKKKKLAGVSFVGTGNTRKRVTTEQNALGGTGSIPFKMNAKAGGKSGAKTVKKVAAFVKPGYRHRSKAVNRHVQVLYYSSVAHLAREDWQTKVDDFAVKEFKTEYPKQLKKASFKGRF